MGKYQTKSIQVDAIQWRPDPGSDLKDSPPPCSPGFCKRNPFTGQWKVLTVTGWCKINPLDYIVNDGGGDYYLSEHEVFEKYFEKAKEGEMQEAYINKKVRDACSLRFPGKEMLCWHAPKPGVIVIEFIGGGKGELTGADAVAIFS